MPDELTKQGSGPPPPPPPPPLLGKILFVSNTNFPRVGSWTPPPPLNSWICPCQAHYSGTGSPEKICADASAYGVTV